MVVALQFITALEEAEALVVEVAQELQHLVVLQRLEKEMLVVQDTHQAEAVAEDLEQLESQDHLELVEPVELELLIRLQVHQ